MTVDDKYGLIQTELGDIRTGEPCFLFRAQDLLAPRALRAYANELYREATRRDDPHLAEIAVAADARAEAMLEWQQENPKLAKYPD